jgi:hypothetical protein
MIPFGPKLNTVFASRWKALLWAGGVLLTAYCSVPSPDESAEADQSAQAVAQALDQAAGQAEAPDQAKPVPDDPWALDKK